MIISCARHSTQGNGNTVAITVLLQLHHTRKVVKVDALLKARQPQDQPGAWGVDLCRGSRHMRTDLHTRVCCDADIAFTALDM